MSTYVSTADLATMLGVSQVTLRVWRHRGEGPPAYRLSRGQVRYRLDEVETWIESRAVEGTTTPVGAA